LETAGMLSDQKRVEFSGVRQAQEQLEKSCLAEGEIVERAPTIPRSKTVRRTMIMLSGLSAELQAEATLSLVRPSLCVVLVFALVVVGIQGVDVEKGAILGGTPFADYLGLVFWGMSPDVAGRRLTSVRRAKAENWLEGYACHCGR